MAKNLFNTRVKFEGLDELKDQLEGVSKAVQGRILANATKKGADIVRNEAKRRAPRRTGTLKRRGIVSRVLGRKVNHASSGVGFRKKYGAHGILVEFGTKPHYQPKHHFQHPGTEAQPFVEPAFDDKLDEVKETIAEELRKKILEEIK